jgi:NADH:ubiquinone oxidoreductase subunit F (NADH-binding)
MEPAMTGARYLLPDEPLLTLDDYLAARGGDGLAAARALGPQGTLDEIAASGLRGRGGAWFPTATKWSSVRDTGSGRRYVVANGAEGEPATFKDRMLMRRDPYRVVEGTAIAALAVGASEVFLATKAVYQREAAALRRAAAELGEAGLLGDLAVAIVEGPEEYLYGEEKALLEVIEGRDPLPRLLPPWQHGLFATAPGGGWEAETTRVSAAGESNPTVVNNVETLATVTHVLTRGATWFRSMGTERAPGTVLATMVGDIQRPGVYEVELGEPFEALLERCGGPHPGRRFRAALSGVSNPVLPATAFDVAISPEDFAARGSGLGAVGFVLYDDSRDMLSVARELSRFLAVESCGQCPPCKDGSMAITERLLAIEEGRGTDLDLPVIEARLRTVTDGNRCFLGQEEQQLISSLLRTFPDDVAAHLEGRGRPLRVTNVPLVKDITDDGQVVYDERHPFKQPDWTYSGG